MTGMIFSVILYLIPFASIAFFVTSLCNYLGAKKKLKAEQTDECAEAVKKSKTALIVSAVIMGVLLTIIISFISLMFMAIAYM